MKPVDVFIDYFYAAKGQLMALANRQIPADWLHPNNTKGDIILIPGLYENWQFLRDLGSFLAQMGYRIHVIKGLNRCLGDLQSESSKIHKYLLNNNIKKATLIGHSKGGLVGLDYLIKGRKNGRQDKLIAIATPFFGTNIGKLVRLRRVRDLLPGGTAITQFGDDLAVNVVSIYPEYDNHIWSREGSVLKGAKNIRLSNKGHHKILFAKELWQEVLANLD